METVKLRTLFDVRTGRAPKSRVPCSVQNGGIAYIGASLKNNGITEWVERDSNINPARAGELTCASNGSVLATFYQFEDHYVSNDVCRLIKKEALTVDELLWYCVAIRQHMFRFNYGRKASPKLIEDLEIPSKDSIPSWVYGMGDEVVNKLVRTVYPLNPYVEI